MPRVIQTATRTDEGFALSIRPPLWMPIGVVAKALALHLGRPDQKLVGKDHVRPAVQALVEGRVNDPGRPEPEVPADVLRLWADWLVDRGIFPAEAVEESKDL